MSKLADSPVMARPEVGLVGLADMNAVGATLLIPSMFTNEVYRFTPALNAAAGQ